ncbi:GNAT family acetyltransferase [Planococcus antarcticus DSM 14505]|uniref:GNAT family N-acetyltransferase n=1 Tax=Planococcus antarcticus DSM 14505 TaxID=1185653 RepID=A0A1C7DDM1_9BACL|nr:GNAT family N-acetyltransferase [Planococcus antarcticus]ANU09517.1 GNAT family N-acetyltransferase [Planococcus antarcticus DSM 14505]EIM06297.1 GNAT family acetyltransferase [Planococcus antarcticus DSM 14505]
MKISNQEFNIKGTFYTIRSAVESDAQNLSEIRVQIDGETQHLDREKGEAFMDVYDFEQLIKADTMNEKNLFLVAVVDSKIVGFSRCEGNSLKRFSHKVEFGVGVLKDYWGYGIGTNLLKAAVVWCDASEVRKITLHVLESNKKAISLYENFDFETEGILINDKIFADGKSGNTVVMGRFK